MTRLAANAKLKSLGLSIGSDKTTPSAKTTIGTVLSATPAAGTLVDAGSEVSLEVSGAPATIPVPDVTGLMQPAAEAKLKTAGRSLGAVKTQSSASAPADTIAGTLPSAGTLANPGSAVDLVVSSGPRPSWTQFVQPGLFAILGLTVLILIVVVITRDNQTFLHELSDKDVARGLITFLIAVTTVGIALILAVSTLILTEGDAGDKRFDRGKQVLTILIGVLGTSATCGLATNSATPRTRAISSAPAPS